LALLLSLVRQSLVAVADDDHFRLLDTVRAHAAEHLAADPAEELAARDRHARWFCAFAQDADLHIRGADQAGWLAELRTARGDLRAALHHCLDGTPPRAAQGAALVCSLSWFWFYEGSFAEAREWIARAAAVGPHEPRVDAWLHLAAGMHAESTGDLRLAGAECTAAVDGFAAIGDTRGEARSLLHLGTVRWALGHLAAAATAQDRSIALFRSARHDSGAGLGLVLRARTALDEGETPRARELLLEARHVLRRVGRPHLVALCVEQQARTCLAEGDLSAAEPLARESLAVFESVGYREGVAAALQTLGRIHLELGDPVTAAALQRRAAGEALDLGHAGALAESLELLAESLLVAGDATSAALLLGRAEHVREERGVPRLPSSGRRLDRWRARLPGWPGDDHAGALAEGQLWATRDLLAQTTPTVVTGPQGVRPSRPAPAARRGRGDDTAPTDR
jgi:tetratricopeptide (TPR) repeat protein